MGRVRKRDKKSKSTSQPKVKEETSALGLKVSLARERASEQVVQRATRGLIRVESRRRFRVMIRRTITLAVIVVIGYCCWYLFGDKLPTEWLYSAWDDLISKIDPAISEYENR